MILTLTNLRKIALTLMMSVAVLGFASPASAQLTLYQTDFENPPFTLGNLVDQDGWVNHSGSGSFIQVIVGQAVELVPGGGSREDASVSLGERGLVAGDILYFMFDVTVNGTDDATTHYFAHFKDGGTGFNTRIFMAPPNSSGKNFTFAIGEISSSTPAASFATDFTYGVRYTLSGSYTFDTGISTLQVNGSGTIINSTTQADPGQDLQFFAFRQSGGNTSAVIDNLFIGGNSLLADIPAFSDGFEDIEPGGFLKCVDEWCLQYGTLEQFTRCESASADGLTCNNPEIRYGSVEGGIPASHFGNQLDIWCQQLGFSSNTGIAYGFRSTAAPNGRLFGSTDWDEPGWHWADWSDGYWLNQSLDKHDDNDGNEINLVSCAQ